MKTQRQSIPKLLGDVKTWVVILDLGHGGVITSEYTNKDLANQDYLRLKSQSGYGGYWIKALSINERT